MMLTHEEVRLVLSALVDYELIIDEKYQIHPEELFYSQELMRVQGLRDRMRRWGCAGK